MKVTIYFDLGTLSDRVLNLLLSGSSEGERPKSQLVREVADAIHNLIVDITELEKAAALAPAGSLEREELSQARTREKREQ
jgi:hypothetical protein